MRRRLLLGLLLISMGCGIAELELGAPDAASGNPGGRGADTNSGAGGFADLPDAGPQTWQWLNPGLTDGSLRAISGTSSDDVWVVGTHGSIIHWDGASWSRAYSGPRTDDFNSVFATTDGVWVGGHHGLLHWNGKDWSSDSGFPIDSAPPGRDFGLWLISSIVGTSSTDVWLTNNWRIQHWDGLSWQMISSGWCDSAARLWSAGPGEVWVGAGTDAQHVVIPNGAKSAFDWTMDWHSFPELFAPDRVLSIWGSSPNDVWATLRTSDTTIAFAHRGGPAEAGEDPTWSILQEEAVLGPEAFYPSFDPHGNPMWGASATDIDAFAGGYHWHYDGTKWFALYPPPGDEHSTDNHPMNAFWSASPDDVWAVGNAGRISRRSKAVLPYPDNEDPAPGWVSVTPAYRGNLTQIVSMGETEA